MPLFDAYVMVDWSGSARRRAGRQDCIWIAHVSATAAEPATVSPPSRTEAEHLIRAQLRPIVAAKQPCTPLRRLWVRLSQWVRAVAFAVSSQRGTALAHRLAIPEPVHAG